MKLKKKLTKVLLCIALMLLLLTASATPAFATPVFAENDVAMALDTQQFQVKEFNPNEITRVVVNTLVALLTVAGAVFGGWMMWMGVTGGDPKEKRQGFLAILASLAIGGMILTVVNMIIV